MNVEVEVTTWSRELANRATKEAVESGLFTTADIEAQLSFSRTQASRLANRFVDQGIFLKSIHGPSCLAIEGGIKKSSLLKYLKS